MSAKLQGNSPFESVRIWNGSEPSRKGAVPMETYWWCPNCEIVFKKSEWTKEGRMGKYGMCPKLCMTHGRKAVDWPIIAKRYGYPMEPIPGETYSTDKLL